VTARFSFLCACGVVHEFEDEARGAIVDCPCGAQYAVPERAGLMGRVSAHVRWLWRWWSSSAPERGSRRAGPYRERGRGASCPCCGDVPAAGSVWQCDLCWCSWHTFETHGRCPGCGFRYLATECLACGTLSRHSDWYV
jgi:hypothetical protein